MRVCVVGSGVIGTIFGLVLAQAGNDVTHYLKPGSGARLREGVEVNLLDARGEPVVESSARYSPPVVERLDGGDGFDLVLASVRHDQLPALLPVLAQGAGRAEVLLFGNLWSSLEPVDAVLAGRYVWGFPVAGGGFEDGRLEAAMLSSVRLGDPAGAAVRRLESLARVFGGCGLTVEFEPHMLAWLWVHFATEAGIIGAAAKAGSVAAFLDDVERIVDGVLAVRDAFGVVKARGVDPSSVPDAQMFMAPEHEVALGIKQLYTVDRAARKIMERHTGGAELKRIYGDVLASGRSLGVRMPTLEECGPFVDELPDSGG
ncbi:MAG: ketopantoate reductase family protein [Solirubrobacteraceae bacterium]